MIERAAIEQRKAQLKAQYDQVVANANALQGAIQECDFWIAAVDKQAEVEKNAESQS